MELEHGPSPAVSLSSSALDHSLDEDAQFLQPCVSADAHSYNADPKAVVICEHGGDDQHFRLQ